MKQRTPATQFYFRQFSGDEHVMAMSLEAIGCHILLICAAGASEAGYSLPNKEGLLRAVCHHVPKKIWKKIYKELLAGAWKLSEDGTRIEQAGLFRSLMKQQEFSKEQSERGKRGMESRWHNGRYPPVMPKDNSALASASATANLSTPLPPALAGDEVFFDWARETIAVKMGRRKRLPNLENQVGARAGDIVEILNRRGFPARVIPREFVQ